MIVYQIINPDFRGRIFFHNNEKQNKSAFCLIHRQTGSFTMGFGNIKDCIIAAIKLAHTEKFYLQVFNIKGDILYNDLVII